MNRAVLILCALALSACQHAGPSVTACLPLKPYTAEEQAQLAAALAVLPDNDPMALALIDYGKMRQADRACLASRP